MKNYKLHIILGMLVLMFSCKKETNWNYSLDKNSTEPYGLYLAYDQLKEIFPNAEKETIYDLNEYIEENRHEYTGDKKYTLLMSITDRISLNKEEAENLHIYASNGGVAVLISNSFSSEIDSLFEIENKVIPMDFPYKKKDCVSTYDVLWDGEWYSYDLDLPFDKDYFTEEAGWGMRKVGEDWKPNIIAKDIGEGQIIFCNSPEMFTNYALLKDSNIAYYEKFLSSFGKGTYYIKWFSKHTLRPKRDRSQSNLMELLKQKPYRYAFFTLLAMALLFLLFETRRRQRQVEVVPPVTNDSLAFTETIGKLYHSRGDNRNLAKKMILYYLEYIRTTYNLQTTHLNKEFAHKLARKLNKSNDEAEQFFTYLQNIIEQKEMSAEAIKQLYYTLKKYQ